MTKRWNKLKDLFDEALELPAADRPAFVDQIASTDAALGKELQSLLFHDAAAGRFLSDSQEEEIQAGDNIAERYQVIRKIGSGGMACVYEAEDTALRERVALKTLRRRVQVDDPDVLRFCQEVQLARKVSHPNICRVFDIGTDKETGWVFLTMELVQGETFAARLRRDGTIPIPAALIFAREIAEGVDAAHKLGILHRDLKPANIMVSSTDRVVVLDFGLALPNLPEVDRLTPTSHIIGTPAYLAPEILQGGRATVASDIYSFALTVREMIAGRPNDAPALLPKGWQEVFAKALSVDPDQRFPSAGALVDALVATPPDPSRLFTRRLWLTSTGAGVVALAAAGLRYYFWRPVWPAGGVLMLADIANTTTDPELDAVTAQLSSQLHQSPYFDLWDRTQFGRVARTLQLPTNSVLSDDIARKVAKVEGVGLILFGGVSEIGGQFALTMAIEEAGPDTLFRRHVWNLTVYAESKAGLANAVHEVSTWVRTTVGENRASIAAHDRLPQDTTTASWQALALYAKAERAQAEQDSQTALSFLHDAVRLDPLFAMAKMRLGDISMSLRRQQEALLYWQGASEAAQDHGRLTQRETLMITGLFATDVWDFATSESSFTQLEQEYPRDYFASFYLANALRWQGRLDEAIRKFEETDRKNPGTIALSGNLISTLMNARRTSEMRTRLAAFSANNPVAAIRYEGLALFVAGDEAAALKVFEREAAATDTSVRSRGYLDIAAVQAEQGRFSDAYATLEEGIQHDHSAGRPELQFDKYLLQAFLAHRLNRGNVDTLLDNALALEKSFWRLYRAALLLTQRRQFDRASELARTIQSEMPECPLRAIFQLRIKGETALVHHNTAEALTAFQQLDRIEPALRPREYLGRAYALAGNTRSSAPILRSVAEWNELLWQIMDYDVPGLITDTALPAAKAFVANGDRDTARSLLQIYLKRRQSALDLKDEVASAKQLLITL